MSTVHIDETTRIKGKERSWDVERLKRGKDRKTGDPVDKWEAVTFHPTLLDAVTSVHNRMLRLSDAETLPQIAAESERLSARLSLALARADGLPITITEK